MKKDKKKLIIMIIISVIIYLAFFMFIVISIWKPNNKGDITKIDIDMDYYEKKAQLYYGKVRGILLSKNVDELYKLLDEKYIMANELNKENYAQKLKSSRNIGESINVYEYTYASAYNAVVFVYKYECMGFKRVVNIIEKKPYEYTISFDSVYIPDLKFELIRKIENIKFNISFDKVTTDSLTYKFEIQNKNEDDVIINFYQADNITIELEDGTCLSSTPGELVSKIIMKTDEKITQNVTFLISSNNIHKIKKIIINGVTIGNKNTKIELNTK